MSSVCPSVKSIYLQIALMYQFEIIIKYSSPRSLEAQKTTLFSYDYVNVIIRKERLCMVFAIFCIKLATKSKSIGYFPWICIYKICQEVKTCSTNKEKKSNI